MRVLTEEKAEKFLSRYVPVAKSKMVSGVRDGLMVATRLKYPVMIKVISRDALHKTEIGGVRKCVNSLHFKEQYKDLVLVCKKHKVRLEGILVQETVCGVELIIGLNTDPVFGKVIMFGIGGTLVEIMRDVTFRKCPISRKDVKSMIEDLKLKEVLYGVRGGKAVNMEILCNVLVDVSKLALNYEIEELDINPFIINDKVGKVVDARIVIE